MGYMHIDNLYKNADILRFKQCYALEKVHGTSAHITYKNDELHFFSGGANHEKFLELFNHEELIEKFKEIGQDVITIYGEAYGGKINGMSKIYGTDLKFVVFEVQIHDNWLTVPNAEEITNKLGLKFVPYELIDVTIENLNTERDKPSIVAQWAGMGDDHPREGIVTRLVGGELIHPNGKRLISKHKIAQYCETKTPRNIGDNALVLQAEAAAIEYVTDERLRHVLDALGNPTELSDTPKVLAAFVEDVLREGDNEVQDNKETRKAIGSAAVKLWKHHINQLQQEYIQNV